MKIVVKFIRREKGRRAGQRLGVVAVVKFEDGGHRTGYSLCNRKLDSFDYSHAISLAVGRAVTGRNPGKVAHSVIPHLYGTTHEAILAFPEMGPGETRIVS